MKKWIILAGIFLAFTMTMSLVGEACRTQYSQDDSEKVARSFLEREATYRFDGMPDTLKLARTREIDPSISWEFVYEFQSRHAGYGDRTGQILLQVITPHEAKITVDKYQVTRAVMDERFDMITQSLVTKP